MDESWADAMAGQAGNTTTAMPLEEASRPLTFFRELCYPIMWLTNILAIPGNCLLFFILMRRRHTLKPHELLLVVLAITDLGHTVCNVVQNIFFVEFHSRLYCMVNQVLFRYFLVTTFMTIIGITVDRYCAICHVMFHRVHITCRKAAMFILSTEVTALVVSVPSMGACYAVHAFNVYAQLMQFLTGVTACGLMAVCYGKIWLTVSTRNSEAAAVLPAQSRSGGTSDSSRCTRICISISVIFISLTMPSITTQFMFTLFPTFRTVTFSDLMVTFYILSLWNTVVNPFIYAIIYPQYSSQLRLWAHNIRQSRNAAAPPPSNMLLTASSNMMHSRVTRTEV